MTETQSKIPAEPFKAIVSADLFRRANLGRSIELYRYYLNGVFITPCSEGGALLVSTDGHILIVIRDPRAIVEGSGIVSLNADMIRLLTPKRDDAKSKHRARSERVVAVSHDGSIQDAVAIVALSGTQYQLDGIPVEPRTEVLDVMGKFDRSILGFQAIDAVVDGKFPNYKEVIPKQMDRSWPMSAFNPTLLTRVSGALCEKGDSGIEIVPTANDRSKPAICFAANPRKIGGVDGFAIVMPLRVMTEDRGLPSWAI